jgi:glutaminase
MRRGNLAGNEKWNKILSFYNKQCSVGVNVAQLACMGATLANNGATR